MEKNLRVKELVLDDNDTWSGVFANSFVSLPAIERSFVFMNAHKPKAVMMKTDGEEKRMVYGPVMIPDLMIYRRDDDTGEEYYSTYTGETVVKCQRMFMKKGLQSATTVEHLFPVLGVTMVESWIINDTKNDKAVTLGYDDLPVNTWMAGYHVEDDALWKSVKEGLLTGFSIEAWFDHIEKQQRQMTEEEQFVQKFKAAMKKISGEL